MLTLIVRNVHGSTSHLATTRVTGHSVILCGARHSKAGLEVRAWGRRRRDGNHPPTRQQSPPKCSSHVFSSRFRGRCRIGESVWLKEDFWLCDIYFNTKG